MKNGSYISPISANVLTEADAAKQMSSKKIGAKALLWFFLVKTFLQHVFLEFCLDFHEFAFVRFTEEPFLKALFNGYFCWKFPCFLEVNSFLTIFNNYIFPDYIFFCFKSFLIWLSNWFWESITVNWLFSYFLVKSRNASFSPASILIFKSLSIFSSVWRKQVSSICQE